MIKMAQLENIRKMYFMEGLSIREINRRTGIHRDKESLPRGAYLLEVPVSESHILQFLWATKPVVKA